MQILPYWQYSSPPAPKCKKATPHAYDVTRRADIRKYAAYYGPTAASRHFSKVCGHKVPESMARKFRDAYLVQLKLQASTPGRVVSVNSLH